MINLHERILLTQQGLNPRPPDHHSDVHPSELPRQARRGWTRDLLITSRMCIQVSYRGRPHILMLQLKHFTLSSKKIGFNISCEHQEIITLPCFLEKKNKKKKTEKKTKKNITAVCMSLAYKELKAFLCDHMCTHKLMLLRWLGILHSLFTLFKLYWDDGMW